MAFHYPVSKKKKIANPNPRFPPTRNIHVFFKQSTVTGIFKRQSSVMCLQICCKFFEPSLGTSRKDASPWKEPFIQFKIAM